MILALIIFFIMPASLLHFRWLSASEKAAYANSLKLSWYEVNAGPINIRQALRAFTDPQVLFLTVITFTNGCMLAGLGYFSGPVIKDLGYSSTKTQLLTVPPFAVAAFGKRSPCSFSFPRTR